MPQNVVYSEEKTMHTVRGKPPFYGKNCNKISASIQQCAREIGSR